MIGEYEFRGFRVAPHMLEGIRNYIEHRIEPGHFLTAVICNDLKEAVGRADDENIHNLPAFVAYFYNEAPSSCWGSREKFEAWLDVTEELPVRVSALPPEQKEGGK